MKRTKYSSAFTLSYEQFKRLTRRENLDIHECLLFAQHIADCVTEKFIKRGWICMNEVRTEFGYPPVIQYCSWIYLREFGDEPVKVKTSLNKLGIVVTMRNYIDLCDGPIK